jgi:CubicO group peptidase (beta-lactamase class C family)
MMHRALSLNRIILAFIVAIIFASSTVFFGIANARSTVGVIQQNPAQNPALTRSDVESWADGFIPASLAKNDIAGAVVVVVKGDQILFSRGYGYAQTKGRKPVDANKTLFRPGSISKLFTWTALMQLVEQGKVGLDTDVNTYLDFKVTGKDGSIITPRHLLTHRAGFEDNIKDLIVLQAKPDLTATAQLKRWVPRRIYPAGSTPAYSNYGAALAGYIVERITGLPFETYVERNIFAPLGMRHSTFQQPIPPSLAPNMSTGYISGAGPAQPFEHIVPAAGALSATGNDIGRFMIAHLQNGRFGDRQILKPSTAKLMHDTALPVIPTLNPMLLGFIDTSINGHRVIGHDGNTIQFHSNMALFKNDGVGMFLSLNSAGTDYLGVQKSSFEAFADRYFPDKRELPPVMQAGTAHDASAIAGYYHTTYRSESNFLSIRDLMQPGKIIANADGSITVDIYGSQRYVHIGPLLWRSEDGKRRFAAALENGRVKWVAGGPAEAIEAFQPFDLATTPAIWLPLGLLAFCIVMIAALAWLAAGAIRMALKQPMLLIGASRTSYRASRLSAILTLAVLYGWMALIEQLAEPRFPSDFTLILLQVLLFAMLLALIVTGLWSGRTAWSQGRRRITFASLALAGAGAILFWIAATHSFFVFNANY